VEHAEVPNDEEEYPIFAADLAEYYRRESEVLAKARAGTATIEDYLELGHTKLGAMWMVGGAERVKAESWAEEWHLWHHGTRRFPVLREVTEADYPPYSPLSMTDRDVASGYEWMAVWADREPYASWLGIDGESGHPDDATARLRWMLASAEEATRNLCHDIQAGTVPLVRRAYSRNRSSGKTTLDITRCVIAKDVMLDFAQRIGGYGSTIAGLLAGRDAAVSDADKWMQLNFQKGDKRDSRLKDCMSATGATWRVSLSAYNRLPESVKRGRGKGDHRRK
jgi:hypothetical protein